MRLRDELGLVRISCSRATERTCPRFSPSFDLFALPSYREGMPRALLEAMATGLPVVATAIRGCREEVVNGETGILVPPRDHEALAAAMTEDSFVAGAHGRGWERRGDRACSRDSTSGRSSRSRSMHRLGTTLGAAESSRNSLLSRHSFDYHLAIRRHGSALHRRLESLWRNFSFFSKHSAFRTF